MDSTWNDDRVERFVGRLQELAPHNGVAQMHLDFLLGTQEVRSADAYREWRFIVDSTIAQIWDGQEEPVGAALKAAMLDWGREEGIR